MENLLCHGLIAEFEKKRAEADQDEKMKKKKNTDPVVSDEAVCCMNLFCVAVQ